MPLFIHHKLLFIHIPKCGGTTITEGLRGAGDAPFLFVSDGSVLLNGHTPQHATWQELLRAGWVTPPDFKVGALVRHPVDRTLSAYRYIHKVRRDLLPFASTPEIFLDHYLSESIENVLRFDNHNKKILDFLTGATGIVDERIYIQPVQNIDAWVSKLGLPAGIGKLKLNETEDFKDSTVFTQGQIKRIQEFYAEDMNWFAGKFPAHC